jgi:hypothetical protein
MSLLAWRAIICFGLVPGEQVHDPEDPGSPLRAQQVAEDIEATTMSTSAPPVLKSGAAKSSTKKFHLESRLE